MIRELRLRGFTASKERVERLMREHGSHLDIWNEQAVNAAISQLELTRIIVVHRPETIAMAKRVVVLQGGTVT